MDGLRDDFGVDGMGSLEPSGLPAKTRDAQAKGLRAFPYVTGEYAAGRRGWPVPDAYHTVTDRITIATTQSSIIIP